MWKLQTFRTVLVRWQTGETWRNLLFKRDESRRQLFFRSPDLNSLASRVWQLESRVRTLSQQQQHNSSSYFKLFLGPHNSPFSTSTSSSSCVVHNSQAIPHSCFPPPKKTLWAEDPQSNWKSLPSSQLLEEVERSLIGRKALEMSSHWLICLGRREDLLKPAGAVSYRPRVPVSCLRLADVVYCVKKKK